VSKGSVCPVTSPAVLAFTAELATARAWGLVTGSGATPEEALSNLRHHAGEQGSQIFKKLWDNSKGLKWRESIEKPKKQGDTVAKKQGDAPVKLRIKFSVGSTRLAYGQIGDKPRWVAYGTLLTDSTGDGTNWFEREAPDKEQGSQASCPADLDSVNDSNAK
jgi:hypothetical protein